MNNDASNIPIIQLFRGSMICRPHSHIQVWVTWFFTQVILKGGCSRGGGNWGTVRIPREDWGTLGKIRGITTPLKNPSICTSKHFVKVYTPKIQ